MLNRRRRSADPAPGPERIEQHPVRTLHWDAVLIWFMRALAIAWLAKGLSSWAVILGVGYAGIPFETGSNGFQATIIYFAVIDLVAAVGLWLTSTWGGVLWLLAVMSHVILTAFFPRIVTGGPVAIAAFVILIVAYLAISWLSANESGGE